MTRTADNPYAPPESALADAIAEPVKLTLLEDGLVDYMAAMRPWVSTAAALSAVGAAAFAAGMAFALDESFAGGGDVPFAVGCGVGLAHLAFVTVALFLYVAAVSRVARTRDRGDLKRALFRRRFANIGMFILLIGIITLATFALARLG